MHDARETARLLLDTIPNLMRGIFGSVRQNKPDDEVLSMGQIRMLENLYRAPRSLSELAALHHVTPSTMSRTVDVLVRRDWIARSQAANDRRQIVLALTDEGRQAMFASLRHAYDVTTELLDQLSDDERTQLYDGLLVLQSLVERTRGDGCSHTARQPS